MRYNKELKRALYLQVFLPSSLFLFFIVYIDKLLVNNLSLEFCRDAEIFANLTTGVY